MKPSERAALYNAAFPHYPPLAYTDRWLYGVWFCGNNYRNKSELYGAYPPDYLDRMSAIFPEASSSRVLHLFSGSLTADCVVKGTRLDLIQSRGPDVAGDAHQLPFVDGAFDFVFADPPYGEQHAKRYGTKMIYRKMVLRESARVVRPGGQLVWLDTVRPMFRKREWREWGSIGLWRSTNHMIRGVMLFERTGLTAEPAA